MAWPLTLPPLPLHVRLQAPIDAAFSALFGAVVGPISGLNQRMRVPFCATLALQGISASSLGMSIGAFAPNTETALAIGPLVMVLSIMLGDTGGMFAEIPSFLKAASELSIIKWGFDGCMAAEFTGLDFVCDLGDAEGVPDAKIAREVADRMCLRTGRAVLEGMGLEHGGAAVARAALAQARIVAFNLGASYLGVRLRLGGGGTGLGGGGRKGVGRGEPPIPYP